MNNLNYKLPQECQECNITFCNEYKLIPPEVENYPVNVKNCQNKCKNESKHFKDSHFLSIIKPNNVLKGCEVVPLFKKDDKKSCQNDAKIVKK